MCPDWLAVDCCWLAVVKTCGEATTLLTGCGWRRRRRRRRKRLRVACSGADGGFCFGPCVGHVS